MCVYCTHAPGAGPDRRATDPRRTRSSPAKRSRSTSSRSASSCGRSGASSTSSSCIAAARLLRPRGLVAHRRERPRLGGLPDPRRQRARARDGRPPDGRRDRDRAAAASAGSSSAGASCGSTAARRASARPSSARSSASSRSGSPSGAVAAIVGAFTPRSQRLGDLPGRHLLRAHAHPAAARLRPRRAAGARCMGGGRRRRPAPRPAGAPHRAVRLGRPRRLEPAARARVAASLADEAGAFVSPVPARRSRDVPARRRGACAATASCAALEPRGAARHALTAGLTDAPRGFPER